MSLDSSSDDELDAAYGPSPAPAAAAPADELDAAFPPADVRPIAATSKDKDKNPYDPNRKTFGQPFGDAAEEFASGIYHNVVGGYKGLYTAATTHDLGKAADAVRAETSQAYQAPKPDFSSAAAGVRPYLEGMQPPGVEALGNVAGDLSERMGGPPLVSALAKSGAEVFGPLAAGGRTGETPPKLTPQGVVDQAAETQSMGAAGATRDISAAPPELQAEVANTDPAKLNTDVLDTHLKAAQFGINLSKGEVTQEPGQWTQEFNSQKAGPEYSAHVEDVNNKLIQGLDEIRRDASPSAVSNDATKNGQQLIDIEKEYAAPKQAAIKQAYDDLIAANGGKSPIDGQRLAGNVRDALDTGLKSGYAPQLEAQVQKFADGRRQMTGQDFESLRTDTAAIMRGNDPLASQAAKIVRQELEKLPLQDKYNANTLQMEGGFADVKPLADKARALNSAWHDEVDSNPTLAAALDDYKGQRYVRPGEKSPQADDFIQKHIVNGSAADLEQLQKRFADNPEAQGVIATAPLNYLKKRAGIDPYENRGDFSQNGYNKALAELRPNLDSLVSPEIKQRVLDLGDVAYKAKHQPDGATPNRSGSALELIRHNAGNAAKSAAQMAMDVKSGGLTHGLVNKIFPDKTHAAFVQDAFKPGAGLDYVPPK
jgi:hypothetical protein